MRFLKRISHSYMEKSISGIIFSSELKTRRGDSTTNDFYTFGEENYSQNGEIQIYQNIQYSTLAASLFNFIPEN